MGLFSSLFGKGKSDDNSTSGNIAPYHFSEAENTACFTCKQVMHDGADILYVTHDEDDGGWQFLSGDELTEEDAMVVSMRNIVDRDPSVNALHDMPEGVGATRDKIDLAWKSFKLS